MLRCRAKTSAKTKPAGRRDHEDGIGDVRGAEDDSHQQRSQVAAADGFHQADMEVRLRQILLKGTPEAIPDERFDRMPVHRHKIRA